MKQELCGQEHEGCVNHIMFVNQSPTSITVNNVCKRLTKTTIHFQCGC